jgi:Family of unknown function (DUF6444)
MSGPMKRNPQSDVPKDAPNGFWKKGGARQKTTSESDQNDGFTHGLNTNDATSAGLPASLQSVKPPLSTFVLKSKKSNLWEDMFRKKNGAEISQKTLGVAPRHAAQSEETLGNAGINVHSKDALKNSQGDIPPTSLLPNLAVLSSDEKDAIRTLFAQGMLQQEQIQTLQAVIAELQAKLAVDNHNSNKPPSADGFRKPPKPKSLRQKAGKKSGGQPENPGKTISSTR